MKIERMSVIDLLNKIAKGERIPKEIKYTMGDFEEFYIGELYSRLGNEDIDINDLVEIKEDTNSEVCYNMLREFYYEKNGLECSIDFLEEMLKTLKKEKKKEDDNHIPHID